MDTPTIVINLKQLSAHRRFLEDKSYSVYIKVRNNKELTPRDEAYRLLEKLLTDTQVVHRDLPVTHIMVFGKLKLISFRTDLTSQHKAMKSLLNYLDVEFQEAY